MKILLSLFILSLFSARASAGDPYREEVLTLSQARHLIEGCEIYAREHELAPLSMAVFDASGNLKFFLRQDAAKVLTEKFAHTKGRSAAVSGLATSELAAIEYENKQQSMGMRFVDGVTIVQGGVAVTSNSGQHLGGMGVSGAPAAHDEACGLAGVKRMQSQ